MEVNNKNRLFLTGYMGAGKTTIGILLAKKLNWAFIDVDSFIENRYRQTISAIFKEKGEDVFRQIEHRILLEICGFEKAIVSVGGGLPCFFDNMEIMNQSGITIYLKASADELIQRIDFNKEKRPLVKEKSPEELKDFVNSTLKNREFFYNQATFIFNVPHFPTKKEMNRWIEELLIQIL